jgi:uncharacterized protein
MTLHTVCLNDVAPQPWKNGGGQTRELLTWPQHAGWALRLSVADITQNGPFSEFKDIRRWIAVLEGEGMHLGEPFDQRVVPDMPTYSFDGQYAAPCELIDGPTRDLNLMIDTRLASGWMRRVLRESATRKFDHLLATCEPTSPDLFGVFCNEEFTIRTPKERVTVPPNSLVWSDDDVRSWRMRFTGRAWAFQCTRNLPPAASTRRLYRR